jgi:hypothetical protein
MSTCNGNAEAATRFGVVARRFCAVVDSASSMDRAALLARIYQILPKLIDEAIVLPDVPLSESATVHVNISLREKEERGRLYTLLKEKLGTWDLYHQVFDPTEDNEAIFGALADDITDIYSDLKEGLDLEEMPSTRPEDVIWGWRLLFYSHWGKHAMNALLTIHFRLQNTVSS